jgi:hypothetical protein
LEGVWFAGKRIEIKYFLKVNGISRKEEDPIVNT